MHKLPLKKEENQLLVPCHIDAAVDHFGTEVDSGVNFALNIAIRLQYPVLEKTCGAHDTALTNILIDSSL